MPRLRSQLRLRVSLVRATAVTGLRRRTRTHQLEDPSMNTLPLSVRARETTGTQAAKRLRQTGWIPATLYGGEGEPRTVQVFAHTMEQMLHHGVATSLVDVTVEEDGENCRALVRYPSYHPVTGALLHIDLLRVTATSRVQADIPIETSGTPAGVLEGGILDQIMRTLSVECLATEMPDRFVVDVSGLQINENLSVSDLDIPEGVTPLLDTDATVVTVSIPQIEEEPEEEEEELEEGAEPELIGAEDEDEEASDEDSDEE